MDLKDLRESRLITQKEVEDETGLSKEQLSRIENGHNNPQPSTLRKLAGCYRVSVETIIEAKNKTIGKELVT